MNEAEKIDYDLPNISKPKWALYLGGVFLAAFVMYFPLTNMVESKIRSGLASIPGCPISYESLGFSFFLPKVIVTNLQIPASCMNQSGAPIVLDESFLYIRGLSFSPFGPNFKLSTTVFNNPIEALITVGFGNISLRMSDASIDLAKISPLLPAGLKLAGKAKINALATIGQIGLEGLDLKLSSKDFAIPAQSIQAFSFSRMNVNNLLLKAKMGIDGNLKVSEFILGDADSPIRSNFSGSIKLSKNNPQLSRLDLKGEVAFSQAFLEQYSIIGMVMNQFDKKDDFYQIQLMGTLANPVPSSPRK